MMIRERNLKELWKNDKNILFMIHFLIPYLTNLVICIKKCALIYGTLSQRRT